jgi:serine/threonine protein kinase
MQALYDCCTSCLGGLLGPTSMRFEAPTNNAVRTVRIEKSIIGEGGFSQVLLASDVHDASRKYAVKKILIQSPEEDKAVTMEIHYLKMFVHDSIVPFYGANIETENGRRVVYMLSPLIRNGNLRQRMNQVLEGKAPPFSLDKLLWSFAAITSAVNMMHSHVPPYVHRDIKPDNILLGDDDKPLLTDFGSVGVGSIAINNRSDVSNN